jgi:hypothetical protein
MANTILGSALVPLASGVNEVKSNAVSVDTPSTINFEPPFSRINVMQALVKAVGPLPDLETPGIDDY